MFNSDYVVGLIDGEGSFTVYIKNPDENKKLKRRVKAESRFYLKLIEKDKEVLCRLKEFFGCGNVYFQTDIRPSHQNCYRYEVASRKDLQEKIIPFFKLNHLKLPSKIRDFDIFCKLIEMMDKGKHLNLNGLRKMYRIKQKMH